MTSSCLWTLWMMLFRDTALTGGLVADMLSQSVLQLQLELSWNSLYALLFIWNPAVWGLFLSEYLSACTSRCRTVLFTVSTTMRECCHSVFGMSDSAVAVVLILSHIAEAVFSVCSTLRLHVPTDAIMSVLYDCLSVFMAVYCFGTAFAIASHACDRGNAH